VIVENVESVPGLEGVPAGDGVPVDVPPPPIVTTYDPDSKLNFVPPGKDVL
jgi:hypothetical protein